MKFLADQDVYALTVRFLSGLGHDVLTANAAGLAAASDRDLLEAAHRDDRLLVTRDRDYGSLVFIEGRAGGVLYLRITPQTLGAVHAELAMVLGQYPLNMLAQSFVVVEPGRHRLRRCGTEIA